MSATTEIAALDKHECPACGGQAEWNPGKQKLICPFCGTESPYVIDRELQRIVTRRTGNTTLKEVLAHFDELELDPDCPPGADVLLDLTAMTSLPNVGQIRGAAERAADARRHRARESRNRGAARAAHADRARPDLPRSDRRR